ncbi:ABC transporter permease [Bacillus sp. HMF5848]|uniref:ABC transporter permease n=1 Tax=Bacillus sp. HMF5848 TaxID=2495421 RepID=UPI000F793287|nr:ABC transporter permease [Bacillus sp. HMF5848]RSK29002.1 ABC transporter permease [Bacillus sp. HMF5848]
MIIFKSMVMTSLRDKISLFYALLFPVGLMIGLGIFFDQEMMQVKTICGVTAISTLFWGMQGISFQVYSQRSKGVYKLLKLTPMSTVSFVFIMTLARTVIGVALNMVVWLIGMFYFHIQVTYTSILATFVLVTVGTLCFTSMGFFIANLANNEGQINIFSNLIQLPMIFMSETFYSLQSTPSWISTVGNLLPFEYYVKGLITSINAYDQNTFLLGMLVPMLYMIMMVMLAAITFKWEERQSFIKKASS